MKKAILTIGIFTSILGYTQNQNVGISSTGSTPNASAMLDVESTTKGLLIPRLALTQTTLATPVITPATSLLVYNTATVNDVTPGYYYWNGSAWERMVVSANVSQIVNTVITPISNQITTHISNDLDTVIGNEYNTTFTVSGGNLRITDGGGTLSVPLSAISSLPNGVTNGNVLVWNGSSWVPGTDQVNDADNVVGNEYNTSFTASGGNLALTDGGGTIAVPLSTINSNDWHTTGNNGTVTGVNNWLGTNDNTPLYFRTNGAFAGRIGTIFYDNLSLGANSNLNAVPNLGLSQGIYNTAIGNGSQTANTIGQHNTSLGSNSLSNNNSIGQNTAIGSHSMQNATGVGNTGVGYNSLRAATGGSNTAIGMGVMTFATSGDLNTAIGVGSLNNLTTGSENTAVGGGCASCNGDGNVAIGGGTLYNSISSNYSTAIGYGAGSGSVGVNFTQSVFVGAFTNVTTSRSNVTLLGSSIANGQCTGNNQIMLGSTAITQIRSQVSGLTTYSDERFKTNIESDVKGLDFILNLNPVTYNVNPEILHKIWNTPDSVVKRINHDDIKETKQIGLIAQEVEEAAKKSNWYFPGIDIPSSENEAYSIRYTDLIMPLIKSVQEQQAIIEDLKKEIIELKNK